MKAVKSRAIRKCLILVADKLTICANGVLAATKDMPDATQDVKSIILTLHEMIETVRKEVDDLELQARLEDLDVRVTKKNKMTKNGMRCYNYWMASWRVQGETRNFYLGSCKKVSKQNALLKAKKMKEESIRGGRTTEAKYIESSIPITSAAL